MPTYVCKQLNEELLAATRRDWENQIERHKENILPSHHTQALDYAEKWLNRGTEPHVYVYALCDEARPDVARVLLLISYTTRKNTDWLKLLGINLEPKLMPGITSLGELAHITAQVITEALQLTIESYPTSQLKVMGHGPLTVDFLEAIVGLTDLEDHGVQISSHNNWLVLDMDKE